MVTEPPRLEKVDELLAPGSRRRGDLDGAGNVVALATRRHCVAVNLRVRVGAFGAVAGLHLAAEVAACSGNTLRVEVSHTIPDRRDAVTVVVRTRHLVDLCAGHEHDELVRSDVVLVGRNGCARHALRRVGRTTRIDAGQRDVVVRCQIARRLALKGTAARITNTVF